MPAIKLRAKHEGNSVAEKVKFSDRIVRQEFVRSTQATPLLNSTPRLFKRGNFEVAIKEVPGVMLSFFNTKKKHALESAIYAAPGCTFDMKEWSGNHDYKVPLGLIAHLHPKTAKQLGV